MQKHLAEVICHNRTYFLFSNTLVIMINPMFLGKIDLMHISESFLKSNLRLKTE